MKLLKPSIRTLLLVVLGVALLIELIGLGRRARHYAVQAQAAATAEQTNRNVIRKSRLAAVQCLEEAHRIAGADPARAVKLRARAELFMRDVPFFEAQAEKSARYKVAFERAATHPWESGPADAPPLATTPPAEP
jgi:hypothetical protein